MPNAIEPIWGSFMEHPAALDYSGDTCFHGCAYCFAIANKQERRNSVTGAIRFLYRKKTSSYQDALLKEGYPICCSNRSDPFSPNNLASTEALFTHLKELPNGVFIQTKTHPACFDLIDMLGPKKAVVFVSIPMLDETIAKTVEPGAPSPKVRLDIIQKLVSKGYHVIFAINPCDPTFLPEEDFYSLVAEIKRIGITHIYTFPLSLSAHRIRRLGPRLKSRLMGIAEETAEIQGIREDYAYAVARELIDDGFEVNSRIARRSNFWEETKRICKRTFPLRQDFVNYCYDKLPSGGHLLLTFKEFYDLITKEHPLFRASFGNDIVLRGYIIRTSHTLWQAHRKIADLYKLLQIFWNTDLPSSKFSILTNPLFAHAKRNGKWLTDEYGNRIVYFDGNDRTTAGKEVI